MSIIFPNESDMDVENLILLNEEAQQIGSQQAKQQMVTKLQHSLQGIQKPLRLKVEIVCFSEDASAEVKIKVGRNHNGITRRSGGLVKLILMKIKKPYDIQRLAIFYGMVIAWYLKGIQLLSEYYLNLKLWVRTISLF